MKSVGSEGEELAVAYLKKRGYRILHRNYRTPVGEADIIVRDASTIVFVEVKSRRSDAFGQPFEAVDPRKREKIKRIALYYLKRSGTESPVRFDVISISYGNGKSEVNHIIDAFEV